MTMVDEPHPLSAPAKEGAAPMLTKMASVKLLSYVDDGNDNGDAGNADDIVLRKMWAQFVHVLTQLQVMGCERVRWLDVMHAWHAHHSRARHMDMSLLADDSEVVLPEFGAIEGGEDFPRDHSVERQWLRLHAALGLFHMASSSPSVSSPNGRSTGSLPFAWCKLDFSNDSPKVVDIGELHSVVKGILSGESSPSMFLRLGEEDDDEEVREGEENHDEEEKEEEEEEEDAMPLRLSAYKTRKKLRTALKLLLEDSCCVAMEIASALEKSRIWSFLTQLYAESAQGTLSFAEFLWLVDYSFASVITAAREVAAEAGERGDKRRSAVDIGTRVVMTCRRHGVCNHFASDLWCEKCEVEMLQFEAEAKRMVASNSVAKGSDSDSGSGSGSHEREDDSMIQRKKQIPGTQQVTEKSAMRRDGDPRGVAGLLRKASSRKESSYKARSHKASQRKKRTVVHSKSQTLQATLEKAAINKRPATTGKKMHRPAEPTVTVRKRPASAPRAKIRREEPAMFSHTKDSKERAKRIALERIAALEGIGGTSDPVSISMPQRDIILSEQAQRQARLRRQLDASTRRKEERETRMLREMEGMRLALEKENRDARIFEDVKRHYSPSSKRRTLASRASPPLISALPASPPPSRKAHAPNNVPHLSSEKLLLMMPKLKSALIQYARDGKLKEVKALLEAGVNADTRVAHAPRMTVLQEAAKRGDSRLAELLVAYGASVSKKDDEGHNALFFAYANGNDECANRLVKAQTRRLIAREAH